VILCAHLVLSPRRIDREMLSREKSHAEHFCSARYRWLISRVLFVAAIARFDVAVIPLGLTLPPILKQPTQGLGRATLNCPSTWPCSEWGFPCRSRYRLRGGLLLRLFTLSRQEVRSGGLISVALSSRFPSPGVARHPALWSPDFPPIALQR
jgi:hypothetical protein